MPTLADTVEHLFMDCAFFLPSTCSKNQMSRALHPPIGMKGGSCNIGTWGNGDRGPGTDSALPLSTTTSTALTWSSKCGIRSVQRSFSCPETSKAVRESVAAALLCSQFTKEISTVRSPCRASHTKRQSIFFRPNLVCFPFRFPPFVFAISSVLIFLCSKMGLKAMRRGHEGLASLFCHF